MKIFAIETSCDETAVCMIEAGGDFGPEFRFKILGNALYSQAALHAQYGGVFPNVAKREHAKNLVPLTEVTLAEAGMLLPAPGPSTAAALLPLKELLSREPELFEAIVPFFLKNQKPDIDAIAVTSGPGLEPALWVGINFAKALAMVWDVPLLGVNHMEGHIIISLLGSDVGLRKSHMWDLRSPTFPMLCLLISGGHTELVLSKTFMQYERLGETRDDAAGEAFDKVARLLDLPYPGGPEISRLAAEARTKNHKPGIKFTPPMLKSDDYDFSFSGLKTEVRKLVEQLRQGRTLPHVTKREIALAFEDAVAEVLVAKTIRAAEEYGARTVVVGGGVSANTFIRAKLKEKLAESDASAQLLVPPPSLATDNALMIALAGYFRLKRAESTAPEKLIANGNLKLE